MVFERSTTSIVSSEDGFIHKFENNSSGIPIYEGVAEPGTSESTAGWKIRKFAYDSKGAITSILFAGGNRNFDNTWTGRDSESYS